LSIKKYLFVVLLFGVLSAQAQLLIDATNKPDHDDYPFYFGLTLGINHSFLHITRSPDFLNPSVNTYGINQIQPRGSGGLELGFMGTVKIIKRLEARFVPKLIIGGSNTLIYYYPKLRADTITPESIKLPTTIFNLPLQLKFNSDRIGNFRVYLFGGVKYDINLSANSDEYKRSRDLGLFPAPPFKKGTLGAEAGIGFSFFAPFAVISPEIRLGTTLGNNQMRDIANPYSNTIDKINQRMLTFSINFEQ
jgi:hypothetical protein